MRFKKTSKYFIFSALLLCAAIFIPKKTLAAEGLSIAPAIIKADLQRGEELRKSVSVKNLGNSALPISLILRTPAGGTPDDVSKWIQIDRPHLLLLPYQVEKISLSITAPANANLKSYTAYLYFEPQAQAVATDMRVVGIAAIPLLFSVRQGEVKETKNISIGKISLSKDLHLRNLEALVNKVADIKTSWAGNGDGAANITIIKKKPESISISLKNNGDYYYYPSGTLELRDAKDVLLAQADIQGSALLPGEEKQYNTKLQMEKSDILAGDFLGKIYADIKLENSAAARVAFWLFPWKEILEFFLLAAGLITAFLCKRRILLAFSILTGKKFQQKNKKMQARRLHKAAIKGRA